MNETQESTPIANQLDSDASRSVLEQKLECIFTEVGDQMGELIKTLIEKEFSKRAKQIMLLQVALTTVSTVVIKCT